MLAGRGLEITLKSIWRAVEARWPEYRGTSGFGSVGVYRHRMITKGLLSQVACLKPTEAGKEHLAGLQPVEEQEQVKPPHLSGGTFSCRSVVGRWTIRPGGSTVARP